MSLTTESAVQILLKDGLKALKKSKDFSALKDDPRVDAVIALLTIYKQVSSSNCDWKDVYSKLDKAQFVLRGPDLHVIARQAKLQLTLLGLITRKAEEIDTYFPDKAHLIKFITSQEEANNLIEERKRLKKQMAEVFRVGNNVKAGLRKFAEEAQIAKAEETVKQLIEHIRQTGVSALKGFSVATPSKKEKSSKKSSRTSGEFTNDESTARSSKSTKKDKKKDKARSLSPSLDDVKRSKSRSSSSSSNKKSPSSKRQPRAIDRSLSSSDDENDGDDSDALDERKSSRRRSLSLSSSSSKSKQQSPSNKKSKKKTKSKSSSSSSSKKTSPSKKSSSSSSSSRRRRHRRNDEDDDNNRSDSSDSDDDLSDGSSQGSSSSVGRDAFSDSSDNSEHYADDDEDSSVSDSQLRKRSSSTPTSSRNRRQSLSNRSRKLKNTGEDPLPGLLEHARTANTTKRRRRSVTLSDEDTNDELPQPSKLKSPQTSKHKKPRSTPVKREANEEDYSERPTAYNGRQIKRTIRTRWTSEEVEALKAGVMKHGLGQWSMIYRDESYPFYRDGVRTGVDLKDKWRNIYATAQAQAKLSNPSYDNADD